MGDNPKSMKSLTNDFSVRKKSMINDTKHYTKAQIERADRIADELVRRFQAPESRNFFLKVAYRLSEDEIWTRFESAHNKRVLYPLRYFIKSCVNAKNYTD